MRRSTAVRLTLLPLLASASLASAQEWPDPPSPAFPDGAVLMCISADDPTCLRPDVTYQDDPWSVDPSLLIVPILPQRGGFGSYFWIGVGG